MAETAGETIEQRWRRLATVALDESAPLSVRKRAAEFLATAADNYLRGLALERIETIREAKDIAQSLRDLSEDEHGG